MKFMEKLEAYFNTGSVEKQNQKRLLLIPSHSTNPFSELLWG